MNEELEYSISQYVDGTLPEAQLAELQKRLAGDAEPRAMLEEYQKLDRAIRASAAPLPALNWDALANHISNELDQADQSAESYKIGPSWFVRGRRLALAAMVLIVAGVAVHLMRGGPGAPTLNPEPLAQTSHADVDGPRIETAAGPALAEVTLTAPAEFADATREYPDAEGVVVQPSHVSIAGAIDHPQ